MPSLWNQPLGRLSALIALLLAVVAWSPLAQESSAGATPHEEYLGIYMNGQRIGCSTVAYSPTTYKGSAAISEQSTSVVKINLLGVSVEQDSSATAILAPDYRPLEQTFDVTSQGSSIHLTAVFDYAAHEVRCRLGSGSSATAKVLNIPPGANLAGDSDFATAGKKLEVGQHVTYYYLEPMTISLDKAETQVASRETVHDKLTSSDVPAYVVTTTMPQGVMTAWESEDGDIIKGNMSMGPLLQLDFVREAKDAARSIAPGEYRPPQDLALATAIQTDTSIPDARSVRTLTARIDGIPNADAIISDPRQREQIVGRSAGGISVDADIRAARFGSTDSAHLPVSDPAVAVYLKAAPYISSDDPAIESVAHELRGSDTNAYRIASHIRDWVHSAMTPDASIGVPRSASDIFHRRRGVCRDYATLYTAVARAAGVPTRICGGVVYFQGRFYYHAWAESYVGRWLAFDPTLYDPSHPVPFVDATHIKFSEGDVTDMFHVVGVVGHLHIKIESFSS